MKQWINRLLSADPLSTQEATDLMEALLGGAADHDSLLTDFARIGAMLALLANRRLSAEEVSVFAEVIQASGMALKLCPEPLLDICGSGGDGKDTFNISTSAALVVAGAGVRVAKHGNRSSTSVCGSSEVISALGIPVSNREDVLQLQIEEAGFCYLHAPLFKPLLGRLAPIRSSLGIRTIFNILGPLVNPADIAYSCLGASSQELVELYAAVLRKRGRPFAVVHSLDGYDEISLTGPFRVEGSHLSGIFTPEQFGFSPIDPADLQLDAALGGEGGVNAVAGAETIRRILSGADVGPKKNVVIVNAGIALSLVNPQHSLPDSFAQARRAIDSGAAMAVLNRACSQTSS